MMMVLMLLGCLLLMVILYCSEEKKVKELQKDVPGLPGPSFQRWLPPETHDLLQIWKCPCCDRVVLPCFTLCF